ncbi:MAG: hypothetical protein H5T84_06165, partial [Thermoleophilia bacterium]|nr:hypothetical protein [Thermoleophilia bacterium]
YLDDLNTFAQSLADAVNEQHRRGLGLDKSSGLNFFVSSTGTINASNIEVNPALVSNPAGLAAGLWRAEVAKDSTKLATDAQLGPGIEPTATYQVKVTLSDGQVQVELYKGEDRVGEPTTWRAEQWLTIGKPETGETLTFFSGKDTPAPGDYVVKFVQTVAAGDGTNALAIARLRRQLIDFDGNDTGDFTFDDYYKNFIARLGVAAHEAQRMVENQNVLVEQLNKRKEAISGVSLDEEMVNLIQYQYAYQAAARVINVVDEMLDTLINRMAP